MWKGPHSADQKKDGRWSSARLAKIENAIRDRSKRETPPARAGFFPFGTYPVYVNSYVPVKDPKP
jgi:hypothetical protein